MEGDENENGLHAGKTIGPDYYHDIQVAEVWIRVVVHALSSTITYSESVRTSGPTSCRTKTFVEMQ